MALFVSAKDILGAKVISKEGEVGCYSPKATFRLSLSISH